jgi:hypothetical protein
MERRGFSKDPPESVAAHSVAATDGTQLVILGESGEPYLKDVELDAELFAAARLQLESAATESEVPALEPEILKALRELGYVE